MIIPPPQKKKFKKIVWALPWISSFSPAFLAISLGKEFVYELFICRQFDIPFMVSREVMTETGCLSN